MQAARSAAMPNSPSADPPPRQPDRRRARRGARRHGGLRDRFFGRRTRPTIRRSARPTSARERAIVGGSRRDDAGHSDRRRGGRSPAGRVAEGRPDIPARRSARRHQGIHQPQRRVHRQHRADRGRRAGARRRARAGARRLPMPEARPAPGRARSRPTSSSVDGWTAIQARPAGRASGRGREPLAHEPGDRGRAVAGRLRRAPLDRLVAEILPARRGRGGFLSAARADDGMGHGGRRRGAPRRRRRGRDARRRAASLRQGRRRQDARRSRTRISSRPAIRRCSTRLDLAALRLRHAA